MNTVKIRDDAIWVSHIEGDKALKGRLLALKAGDIIVLEVDGIVGPWERMRDGRDGRPTHGIKPVSSMREAWARLRSKTGTIVPIREVRSADSYLAAVAATLSEWDSPEDERAYADL